MKKLKRSWVPLKQLIEGNENKIDKMLFEPDEALAKVHQFSRNPGKENIQESRLIPRYLNE